MKGEELVARKAKENEIVRKGNQYGTSLMNSSNLSNRGQLTLETVGPIAAEMMNSSTG